MVKNHCLAKSINDAAWYRFREWLEYFGAIYGVKVIAVDPRYTSQNCSNCGQKVTISLSTRTHRGWPSGPMGLKAPKGKPLSSLRLYSSPR